MSDIAYPHGCKPILEDLGQDELIRRLKNLTNTLQAMGQDEGLYQQYIPLALHLADEYFLNHSSRDVQLLIACCIADVLRVYAPEAPYKDQEQVKGIFMFLIKQLNGLKDPKDPAFKRYFYLLENLAYVKSFNMCFELEDCQEIFCELFSLMFKIVNDEHSGKVKSFMLDVLCPLITESDIVSNELLDILLIQIVEPQKSSRKNAYNLAKDLIAKTADTLENYIQSFFNQILVLDKNDKGYAVSSKIYDLIYELNVIAPPILLFVLPQLECKLKSSLEVERQKAVALLARMFSEKNSQLAKRHNQLWRNFLGRFYDIAVPIRIKCVQSTMHFLLNHPHLRPDIIEVLRIRQHDSDETVRYEVVMSIVETAKRDFQIVSESDDLLDFVKERTLDKKFKIRKEAMNGLAMIYKKYLSDSNVPEATKKAVNWIKDKILHGYYMTGIEDRLLVERLLITCLVPYQLPVEERMKRLYQLLSTIDENANKAFIELQKNQLKVRKFVSDWIRLHRNKEITSHIQKDMNIKCGNIAKQLPEPVKAQEFLMKFSTHMKKDPYLVKEMETILKRDVSCKECADTMSSVLKKLGQPIMTNLYYNTVKMLLERVASVMVDKCSIEVLIGLIEQSLDGNPFDEIGIPQDTAGERGLKLLSVLSFIFSAHFQHESILIQMVMLLRCVKPFVAPYVLKALTHLGRYKPLIETFPIVIEKLAPICLDFALIGTPKQAKHAVRCVFVNTLCEKKGSPVGDIFPQLVEHLKNNLDPSNENYRSAIVCLGHVAYNMPERFQIHIKNIISRRIVKELLVKDDPENRPNLPKGDWCDEESLPEETKCKVEGLKAMARWLLGLKNDVTSAQKTFRMLTAFIKQNGDLLDHKRLSPAEMSWLRLSAGKAMLKICEQKGVGDQYNAEQFYILSQLMIDPVPEVREIIGKKLHKGLNKGIPLKSLPLDFMGFYVLGGRENDRRLSQLLKSHIEADVIRRREFIKSFATVERAMRQLPHILPDYMLLFSITVLTHDPNFSDPKSFSDLKGIEKCLWLILEPLIKNKEFFCFAFYKNIIDKLKNHINTYKPDDELSNIKMWTICDMAMHLIYTRATNYDTREFPLESRIPDMFFVLPKEDLRNTKIYLPTELFSMTGLPIKLTSMPSTLKSKSNTTTNNTSRTNDRSENGDQLDLVEQLEEDDNDLIEPRHNDNNEVDEELIDGENETTGDHDEEMVEDEDDDEDYSPPPTKRVKPPIQIITEDD